MDEELNHDEIRAAIDELELEIPTAYMQGSEEVIVLTKKSAELALVALRAKREDEEW